MQADILFLFGQAIRGLRQEKTFHKKHLRICVVYIEHI